MTSTTPTRPSRTCRSARHVAHALLATLALAACAGPPVVDRSGPGAGLMAKILEPVVFEVDETFAETPPLCIAVLPFTTALADGEATIHAAHVRRAIYAHLAPLSPRDVELAQIDGMLQAMSSAARRDYTRLGRSLQCDTLLLGTLLEHRQRYMGLYSEIVIGAELELVRASDGAVLWQARHIASSRGGGLPISPLSAIEGAVRAATNLLGEQRERVTEDLARRLVRTLPQMTLVVTPSPSQLAMLAAG